MYFGFGAIILSPKPRPTHYPPLSHTHNIIAGNSNDAIIILRMNCG